jgi:hypothetical protein
MQRSASQMNFMRAMACSFYSDLGDLQGGVAPLLDSTQPLHSMQRSASHINFILAMMISS